MLLIAQSGDIALQHASTASFARVELHNKLSEFGPSPFHKDEFSRIRGRIPHSVPCTPSGQNHEVRKESQPLLDSPLVKVRQLLSEVTGTSYLYHSSCLSRAPPLSPLAKREKQGFSTFSNLPLCYSPFPSGQRGIGLVEGLPGSMEWKSSRSELSRQMPPEN